MNRRETLKTYCAAILTLGVIKRIEAKPLPKLTEIGLKRLDYNFWGSNGEAMATPDVRYKAYLAGLTDESDMGLFVEKLKTTHPHYFRINSTRYYISADYGTKQSVTVIAERQSDGTLKVIA